ncbi:hypothetical protein QBC45DRAFT_398547 [Copromyces sp. CBS 386.78]|nr:hypothetical protein QBC45DRAFT_398547 [Copromyces sp. CBS 386.78]
MGMGMDIPIAFRFFLFLFSSPTSSIAMFCFLSSLVSHLSLLPAFLIVSSLHLFTSSLSILV